MIRADFVYTLDAELPVRDAVDQFLFQTRSGYCEHFSSAFTVLMRAAGIPARVVTGYVGGYRNPLGGYWVVRRMDAHAWAEVWLEGRGWVRVDPTAAVAPERIYDTLEQRVAAGGVLDALSMDNLGDLADWMRRGWNDWVLGFDAARQQALLRPLGLRRLDHSQLLALFAAFAALALSRHDLAAGAGRTRARPAAARLGTGSADAMRGWVWDVRRTNRRWLGPARGRRASPIG